MAFLDDIKSVLQVVAETIKDFFGGDDSYAKKYFSQIAIALVVVAVTAGGYFGHRWYVVSREQAAHQTLADYMQDYQLAMKVDTPAEWERVDSLLSYGYSQHKKSHIAPLFLALRADLQLKRGEFTQATQTLQEVIGALPSASPLAPLFKTKRALISLDNSDEAVQKNGLEELLLLARDSNNQLNDMALFYLGRYYWSKNSIEDAKKAWQDLVDTHSVQEAYPSPWVQEASKSLKLISQ